MTDQSNSTVDKNDSDNKNNGGVSVDRKKAPFQMRSWQQALCSDMQERGQINDLARQLSHDS